MFSLKFFKMVSKNLKRNIFKIFCSIIFLQILMLTVYITFTQKNKPTTVKSIKISAKQYAIFTKGCRIPYLEQPEVNLTSLLAYAGKFKCSKSIPLIGSNLTSIFINLYALESNGIQSLKDLNCCYEPFWRIPPKKNNADMNVKFGKPIYFNTSANINDSFIKVFCNTKYKMWREFFVFPPKIDNKIELSKKSEKKRITENQIENSKRVLKGKNRDEERLNIIIAGIDSISRTRFHGVMPRLSDFMKKLKAIEFFGYNSLDYSSFGNIIPLLTGMSSDEFMDYCSPRNHSRYDNCSFIWSNFSREGYFTSFAEESPQWGYFYPQGWFKQPTDFYMNYFTLIAFNEVGHHDDHYPLCIGQRPMFKILLKSMDKLFLKLKNLERNFFSVYWQTSLIQDIDTAAYLADEDFVKHFEFLNHSGILNKSLLIFLSDHGFRWEEFGQRKQFDSRLPFLFWVFPDWFKKKYKSAIQSLELNAYRLVTTYDIFPTLNHLLSLEDLTDAKIKSTKVPNQRGISLFYPIPEERTCTSAGIPPNYCVCHGLIPVSKKGVITMSAANFIIFYLNSLLENENNCAYLELDDIVSAHLLNYGVLYGFGSDTLRDYIVTFKTKPSGAIFQATVRCSSCTMDDFQLTGPVGRQIKLDSESSCVKNKKLKMYCHCINK